MNRINNATARRTAWRSAIASILLVTVGVALPAAAVPVFPGAAETQDVEGVDDVEADIVAVVLERHLRVAADRAARPWAHGGTSAR